MPSQSKIRDGAILMLVRSIVAMVLGFSIALPAAAKLPESLETVMWAGALVVGAAEGLAMSFALFRRAKGDL